MQKVARQLQQKAETVTIEKVRKLLGTGRNTAAGFLRQWYATEEARAEPQGRPQLVILVHGLYQQIEQTPLMEAQGQMWGSRTKLAASREHN